LEEADKAAWLNDWISAEPIYKRAETSFLQKHELSKALYARVSQTPAHMESGSLPDQIWTLTQDLALPAAQDPQTRLRILVVRGMIEVNYDAATARSTWAMVQTLAQQQHQYLLASRATGEQGIAAFILGDVTTAKKQVVTAWTVAKYANDQAAEIRYASVYSLRERLWKRPRPVPQVQRESRTTQRSHQISGTDTRHSVPRHRR